MAVVDSFNNCAGVEAPCSGHGTCVDEVGGFSCACDDLWRGALCDEPGDGYAVITLVGANPLTVEADASLAFADPGATAVGPYDGDVTALVSVAGAVTRSSPGMATLRWLRYRGMFCWMTSRSTARSIRVSVRQRASAGPVQGPSRYW